MKKLEQLVKNSVRKTLKKRDIVWPDRIKKSEAFFTEKCLSLYGTKFFKQLSNSKKAELKRYECKNFFSLSIHNELELIERLEILKKGNFDESLKGYLDLFKNEEVQHSEWFKQFCDRYLGGIYPSRNVKVADFKVTSEEVFFFFLQVLVFEHIVIVYNRAMSRDTGINSIVRQINLMHYQDEVAHIEYDKVVLRKIFPALTSIELESINTNIKVYFRSILLSLSPSFVYVDAGLNDVLELSTIALDSIEKRIKNDQEILRLNDFLKEFGLTLY